MANQINKIDDSTLEIVVPQNIKYDINNLINRANTLTQNISAMKVELAEVNDIIQQAKSIGIKFKDTDILAQDVSLDKLG